MSKLKIVGLVLFGMVTAFILSNPFLTLAIFSTFDELLQLIFPAWLAQYGREGLKLTFDLYLTIYGKVLNG